MGTIVGKGVGIQFQHRSFSRLLPPDILADGNTFLRFEPSDSVSILKDGSGNDLAYWDLNVGKEILGAEQSSGEIVINGLYKITATQTNFFYTGCAVGDIFACGTIKICDANNKVQRYSGNILTQPTVSKRGLNGFFDGVLKQMQTAAATLNQPETIWLFFRQLTWVNTYYIFDGYTGSTGALIQYDASPELDAFAGKHSTHDPNAFLGTWNILKVTFNGVNSKLQVNDNTEITFDCGTANMGGFTLAGLGGGNTNIEVAEGIIRHRITDTSDNNTIIKNYLKKKHTEHMVNVVFDGHSMISGTGSTLGKTLPVVMSQLFWTNDKVRVNPWNYGVAGQTLTQMESDAATQIDSLKSTKKDILVVWGGVNDFGLELSTTKETIYSRLVTYCTNRKAAGWKVYVITMTPQSIAIYSGRTNFETERQWFNNKIKTDLINSIDGVIDAGGNSTIGDAGDELDTNYYYTDKIHMVNSGYAIVAQLTYDAIKSAVIAEK